MKQFGIVAAATARPAAAGFASISSNARCERRAVVPAKAAISPAASVLSAVDHLAMALWRARERLRAALERFQRRQRGAKRPIRSAAASSSSSSISQRGSLRCSSSRLARKVASACARPAAAGPRPRAAQQRALQRRDRACMRARRGAEPQQRMLEQRQQRAPARGRRARPRAASRANTPAGVSASESPPESSTATCQRSSAATTRRASARSGVTSAAVLSGVSTASRSATAMASASSSALAASIMLTPASAVSAAASKSSDLTRALPAIGGGGRPQRFRYQHLAAVRGRGGELFHVLARDADALEQRLHGELRMAGGGSAVMAFRHSSSPAISRHDASSRSVSRPGSTTAPCGSLRDGCEQLGGRRHRAGRAGGDHRCVAAGEPLRFGLDQQIAPVGGFDLAEFLEALRPKVARDLEEVERQLPIRVELVRHQAVELFPVHLPRGHVVHQPGEIVGERRARRPACWRSAASPSRGAHRRRIRPFHDQLREQKPAFERLRSRAAVPVRLRRAPGGGFCEDDLVFVEIAERDDARQDRGLPVERGRGRRRAPAGRRAASADKEWHAQVRADRAKPESRRPGCRRAARRSAPAETAAEAGMLKTLGLCGWHRVNHTRFTLVANRNAIPAG